MVDLPDCGPPTTATLPVDPRDRRTARRGVDRTDGRRCRSAPAAPRRREPEARTRCAATTGRAWVKCRAAAATPRARPDRSSGSCRPAPRAATSCRIPPRAARPDGLDGGCVGGRQRDRFRGEQSGPEVLGRRRSACCAERPLPLVRPGHVRRLEPHDLRGVALEVAGARRRRQMVGVRDTQDVRDSLAENVFSPIR